ncbi:hypothetical protein JCM8202_004511 [Rhodotorula sphaerocarpa]
MTARAHVLERIEQSQIEAALAASCQSTTTTTPPHAPPNALPFQLPPLPTATKYGDLGSGTLLTTTAATSAGATSLGQRTSSEEKLLLLSSVGQPADGSSVTSTAHAAPQRIVPSDPSAMAAPPVRAPRRMLLDPSEMPQPASSSSKERSYSRRSPMIDPFSLPASGPGGSIVGDDTAEVIGDSDGEGISSGYVLSDASQPVAPRSARRPAPVSSSSVIDPSASAALPGPSKPSKASRASDSIEMTTTTPSTRTGTGPSHNKSLDIEIVIGSNRGSKRTVSGSSSASKAKGKLGREQSHQHVDEDDAPRLSDLRERRSKTIAHASPEPDGDGRAASPGSESPDELHMNPTRRVPSLEKVSTKKRKASLEAPADDLGEEVLAVTSEAPTNGSTGADVATKKRKPGSRANSRTAAVSEDEDGRDAAQLAAIRANEQAEEQDDDYGATKKRKKSVKKQKAAPKKQGSASAAAAASEAVTEREVGDAGASAQPEAEKALAVETKAPPRRVPTVPKKDVPAKTRAEPVPSSDQPTPGRPRRQRKERTYSAHVNESPLKTNAKAAPQAPKISVQPQASVSAELPQEQEAQEAEAAQAGPPQRKQNSKRPRKTPAAVQDSEEEDHRGAADTPADMVAAPPESAGPPHAADPAPVLAEASAPRRTKSNQRKRIVQSSDAEDEGAASDATSAIRSGDECSDDDGPVVRVGEKASKGKTKKNAAAKEDGAGRAKRAKVGEAGDRSRRRSASTEARIEQMMKAAETDQDASLLLGSSKVSAASRKNSANAAVESNEDEEEQGPKPMTVGGDGKENEGSAVKKANARDGSSGTPVPQRARSSSTTPFSKQPRPGSLAAIMAKKGLATFRAPGLSARQRVPPLHTNLKPPPPPKKALPENKVRKKKGDESYSDEEKPWYLRKHPEEWDDEDHRRWQRRQKRIERGLPADSDEG